MTNGGQHGSEKVKQPSDAKASKPASQEKKGIADEETKDANKA